MSAKSYIEAHLEASVFPKGLEGFKALLLHLANAKHARITAEMEEALASIWGLLLLSEFGGAYRVRDGKHRIHLGQYGFFDPFSSLLRILDHKQLKQGLMEEMRTAEMEAKGRQGVGRVVRLAAECLLPYGQHISEQFEAEVELSGGIAIQLASIVKQADTASDAQLKELLEQRLSFVTRASKVQSYDGIKPLVLPRCMRVDPSLTALCSRPLTHGVGVYFVIQAGKGFRFITQTEFDTWKVDAEQMLRDSIFNLASRSNEVKVSEWVESSYPLFAVSKRDGMDASRLLLPAIADILYDECGGTLLAAIPHRDLLLVTDASDVAMKHLREHARAQFIKAPHAISEEVFMVRRNGLRLVEAKV